MNRPVPTACRSHTTRPSARALAWSTLVGTFTCLLLVVSAPRPALAGDVENTPPLVHAGLDRVVASGAAVTLAGSAVDPDGPGPYAYTWTQIAGTTVALAGADTATAAFTAPGGPVVLEFALTVSDGIAAMTDWVSIAVLENAPPVVEAGPDLAVRAGTIAELPGTATDPDAYPGPLTYRWTQLGSPSVSLTNAGSSTSSFVVPGKVCGGTLTFQLTVSDGFDAASDLVRVRVLPAAGRAVRGDLTGDGASDRAVYRQGAWLVSGQPATFLGLPGDVPASADFDGDGAVDPTVYRAGAWLSSCAPTTYLGVAGDVPVPGDYDGDGVAEPAVFRGGGWFVAGRSPVFLGLAGDVPVPGDYDGDGRVEPAVFRGGGWFVAGQPPLWFGRAGDVPLTGH